ncbi:hypothetical protein [Lacticaseibacillus manihotivorans]|jgi:hypothetical protein|nr:hypothetical protein [Lacticaseibacillus manihotivorans]QFQ92249.1 hypothetical protein LM010_12845 [Lacticaseibacillus manihotivorans]
MIDMFFMILDAGMIIAGGYFLYWQNKIDVRAGYALFQVFFAGILAALLVESGSASVAYIIFSAAFVTLVIMAGTSGLTPTKVIATGVFSRVIPYTKLSAITLTPLDLPNGRQMVVAIFNLTPRRFVRMTFRSDLASLIAVLRPRVPENIQIAVEHVQ